MTRERFDKILIEEGVINEEARDLLWETRPTDELDENTLRIAAAWTVPKFPEVTR